MNILEKDKNILKELGKKVAEIAHLPINEKRKIAWKQLNGLKKVKPLVCIYEIPWQEMNVGEELTLKTTDELSRQIEWSLRETLYRWKHLQGDMVVEPVVYSPLSIIDTNTGITEDVEVVKTDEKNPVVSRHFNVQIRNEDDIEKIKMPKVTHDEEKSEENDSTLKEILDGSISVQKGGVKEFVFNAWDELVRWTGIEEVLMDISQRPGYVHKAIDRLTQAYLHRLDQYENLKLLLSNNDNSYVTSGGYGYTDDLPSATVSRQTICSANLWGRSMSQVFSAVSPAMHEEFALQYEMRWLKRFGLTYYGCCEPLHRKIDILKKIPNLRKISMSPWINFDEAVDNVGDNYVFSLKPNPAFLAQNRWNLTEARNDLKTKLAKARNCIVEIVLKDISTVCYEPERLWEWTKMASEEAEKFT